jgi:hypothetical protein
MAKWVPYCDFRHFSGTNKPWRKKTRKEDPDLTIERMDQIVSSMQYWFHLLRKLKERLTMDVDIEHLDLGASRFGGYPTPEHMQLSYEAKQTSRLIDGEGTR